MSRSYKKAIVKDRGLKKLYWKIVRRVINERVKKYLNTDPDDVEIPNPKEIMNDYNYSDYTIDYHHDKSWGYFWYNGKKDDNKKWIDKFKRK